VVETDTVEAQEQLRREELDVKKNNQRSRKRKS
jgi:stress response protein YsnF